MRLSRQEKDALFLLLAYDERHIIAGFETSLYSHYRGQRPHKNTLRSLERKGFVNPGVFTGAPYINFDGPWRGRAAWSVVIRAQKFLDEIDAQFDVEYRNEPRMIDSFSRP
jgi:hypothetical protein